MAPFKVVKVKVVQVKVVKPFRVIGLVIIESAPLLDLLTASLGSPGR